MMRTRYVLVVFSGTALTDMETLGNNIRSVISMGLREGVDGVGKSESETWFVEGCPVCRSWCKHHPLPTLVAKLIRRLKFNVPRLVTYRILCEGLDAVGEIMDAIECFHQMTNELTEERVAQDEQASWVLGEQSYKQYGWRF